MDAINLIRDLIASDKLKEAFTHFRSIQDDDQNTILLLMSRLSRLEKQEIGGLLTEKEATLERNRIRYAMLSLLTDVELTDAGLKDGPIEVTDKGAFEKLFSDSQLHRIDWLRKGLEKSNCVCKIHCNGSVGTGFLVADRFVFTNNHVIESNTLLGSTQVEFGYDDPGTASVMYDLEPDQFQTSPFKALDYTRVRIRENATVKPITDWGHLQINTQIPKASDALTIIQHPQGRRKEIAFSDTDNSVWEHRLHYKISTEPGSSGSPVFDMNWNVVALHHAGGDLQINAQGDKKYVNEGILFFHIMKDIESKTGGS